MPTSDNGFGLDRGRTFAAKIGRTFLLLIVGGFFLIFTAVVFAPKQNTWWLVLLKIVIETCWTFWGFAILYVWFEWPWVRAFYEHSEGKFLRVATVARWILPFLAVVAFGLVWYLTHIGVLPVAPK